MDPVGAQPLPFPLKLHNIIEREPRYIDWSADGKTFQIFNNNEFVHNVLACYFRTARMASFTRNLNIYGFRKLSKGRYMGCYYHPDFTRTACTTKIKEMKRYVNGTKPAFYYVESIDDNDLPSAAHPKSAADDSPLPRSTSLEDLTSSLEDLKPSLSSDSNCKTDNNRVNAKRRRSPSLQAATCNKENPKPPMYRNDESVVANLSRQAQPTVPDQQETHRQHHHNHHQRSRSDGAVQYPNHFYPDDHHHAGFSVGVKTEANTKTKTARPSLSANGFRVPAAPMGPPPSPRNPTNINGYPPPHQHRGANTHHETDFSVPKAFDAAGQTARPSLFPLPPRNDAAYGRRESLFEGQLPKRRQSLADIFGCMESPSVAIHRFHSDPHLDPLSPLGFTPHVGGSMSPAVNACIEQYYKALGTKDLYAQHTQDSPKSVPN